MEQKLRFALFGNEYQTEKSASAEHTIGCLLARGAEVWVERVFHDFLCKGRRLTGGLAEQLHVFDGSDFRADFAISMGGDGTFLKAASMVGAKQVPILGVNMGRLGFLADVPGDEVETAIDALYHGHYVVKDHAVVGCEAGYALNDIAVLKRDNASMITIHARVNGEPLVTYQADGLIVSTPTGSTAYNLSNGGPIMMPQTGILCLTPVAPHSLNIRPIVVKDDSRIELSVESRSGNFLVAVDGRSSTLEQGTSIHIVKADYQVRIVKRPSHSYFSTLREKMMWGVDAR